MIARIRPMGAILAILELASVSLSLADLVSARDDLAGGIDSITRSAVVIWVVTHVSVVSMMAVRAGNDAATAVTTSASRSTTLVASLLGLWLIRVAIKRRAANRLRVTSDSLLNSKFVVNNSW